MFQEFEERVQANLEVVLSRTCERLGAEKESHEARKFIAQKLLDCAREGKQTLGDLTCAGVQAAQEYLRSTQQAA